jgi:hypothetical protein
LLESHHNNDPQAIIALASWGIEVAKHFKPKTVEKILSPIEDPAPSAEEPSRVTNLESPIETVAPIWTKPTTENTNHEDHPPTDEKFKSPSLSTPNTTDTPSSQSSTTRPQPSAFMPKSKRKPSTKPVAHTPQPIQADTSKATKINVVSTFTAMRAVALGVQAQKKRRAEEAREEGRTFTPMSGTGNDTKARMRSVDGDLRFRKKAVVGEGVDMGVGAKRKRADGEEVVNKRVAVEGRGVAACRVSGLIAQCVFRECG